MGITATDLLHKQVVEIAYQRTKNFDRLSFLYLLTGNQEKLGKMLKISEMRGDQMSRFHNALYLGNVAARVATLKEVGLCKSARSICLCLTIMTDSRVSDPLAYATAKSNGMDELAQEVLEESGLSEEEAASVSVPVKASNLCPPAALPSATDANWPSVGIVESFFDRALNAAANGETLAAPSGSGYANGADAGNAGLDEWSAEDGAGAEAAAAEEVEDAWDIAAEEPEVDASGVDANGELDDSGEAAGLADAGGEAGEVRVGISESALWARNSPLAADHVAAGSFETAMQLLNRQVGAVDFTPLKPLFLQIYSASKLYLPANASLPPLAVHLRRNPEESDPRSVLPVAVKSLQSITSTELRAAYSAFNRAKFTECLEIFHSILSSLLLLVASNPAEENEVSQLSNRELTKYPDIRLR